MASSSSDGTMMNVDEQNLLAFDDGADSEMEDGGDDIGFPNMPMLQDSLTTSWSGSSCDSGLDNNVPKLPPRTSSQQKRVMTEEGFVIWEQSDEDKDTDNSMKSQVDDQQQKRPSEYEDAPGRRYPHQKHSEELQQQHPSSPLEIGLGEEHLTTTGSSILEKAGVDEVEVVVDTDTQTDNPSPNSNNTYSLTPNSSLDSQAKDEEEVEEEIYTTQAYRHQGSTLATPTTPTPAAYMPGLEWCSSLIYSMLPNGALQISTPKLLMPPPEQRPPASPDPPAYLASDVCLSRSDSSSTSSFVSERSTPSGGSCKITPLCTGVTTELSPETTRGYLRQSQQAPRLRPAPLPMFRTASSSSAPSISSLVYSLLPNGGMEIKTPPMSPSETPMQHVDLAQPTTPKSPDPPAFVAKLLTANSSQSAAGSDTSSRTTSSSLRRPQQGHHASKSNSTASATEKERNSDPPAYTAATMPAADWTSFFSLSKLPRMMEPEDPPEEVGIEVLAEQTNKNIKKMLKQAHEDDEDDDGEAATMLRHTPTTSDTSSDVHDEEESEAKDGEDPSWTLCEKLSHRVALSPRSYLVPVCVITVILSLLGLFFGNFSLEAEVGGWQSRGTFIAKRQTQTLLTFVFQNDLFYGRIPETGSSDENDDNDDASPRTIDTTKVIRNNDDVWDDLTSNVQKGWEGNEDYIDLLAGSDITDGSSSARRLQVSQTMRLQQQTQQDSPYLNHSGRYVSASSYSSSSTRNRIDHHRQLQGTTTSSGSLIDGCPIELYDTDLILESRLWPLWKINHQSQGSYVLWADDDHLNSSSISAALIHDLCVAETKTQELLVERDLCVPCSNDDSNEEQDKRCLPPLGLVFFARVHVGFNGFAMTCAELAVEWVDHQQRMEQSVHKCLEDLKATYEPSDSLEIPLPASCPLAFSPFMVDQMYDETSTLQYTSTIFVTHPENTTELFELAGQFDTGKGSNLISGAYDTQNGSFNELEVDEKLISDILLLVFGAILITLAMIVHTKSVFITLAGLFQIIFSFPLAFFVYKLVFRFAYFPFLNFMGAFVIFALGADDVFVAVDKWKNARLKHPTATTERIARLAFPDAAGAMWLTTLTTAVAFFATAICPVAPVRLFAVFVGLLVILDYLLNVALVFPALVIYDRHIQAKLRHNQKPHWFYTLTCNCGAAIKLPMLAMPAANANGDDGAGGGKSVTPSLIHSILGIFYEVLHRLRWISLGVCLVALAVSTIFASRLALPLTSDVRLLPDSHPFEQNFVWRQQLLSTSLQTMIGGTAYLLWGVKPADTGQRTNPGSWSQLVLDSSFDPSSEEAQLHLLEMCDDFMQQEFASPTEEDFVCPFRAFDAWLRDQGTKPRGAQDHAYMAHCHSYESLPLPHDVFHECMVNWSQQPHVQETSILSRDGKVTIIFIPFVSRARYDDQHSILDSEWKLIEYWMGYHNRVAPAGVNKAFFSSIDFWWYDTNGQMFRTAYGSAGIALSAAALVVLFSSRSLVLTVFSVISIAFVLSSVTAVLVSLGWALGFLESICFAILIGISVDYVIHFGHAYTAVSYTTNNPNASKYERSRHALMHMGPSILAAAVTTGAAAIVMLFTEITFYKKFALILLLTVIQASVAAFVVYLTMTECIGPSNPTYVVDHILEHFRSFHTQKYETLLKREIVNQEEMGIVRDDQEVVAIIDDAHSPEDDSDYEPFEA